MRLIFIRLLLLITISTPSLAGVRKEQKWANVTKYVRIDTQDVRIKGDSMRFYIVGELGPRKLRINCSDVSYKLERYRGWEYGWVAGPWNSIPEGTAIFEIANQLCFLSSASGVTPEESPPKWAKLIIQRFRNIGDL